MLTRFLNWLRSFRKPKTLSGSGSTLAFSVGGSDQPLPEPTDTCEVVDRSGGTVTYGCNHEDSERFAVSFYGDKIDLNEQFFAERPYCGTCLLAKATEGSIRCALCGFIIHAGDAVALYSGGAKFRKDVATKVDGQHVGCLRWDCCPSGGFYAGHWTKSGYRPAFEHGSAAGQAMATGQMVVSNPEDDKNDKR